MKTTLIDISSYRLNGCKPLRPSQKSDLTGKKKLWVVQCYCGELFHMTQELMGKSRSEKRRLQHYSCGCNSQPNALKTARPTKEAPMNQ